MKLIISTKDIAEVTNKKHGHVIRDLKKVLKDAQKKNPVEVTGHHYHSVWLGKRQIKEVWLSEYLAALLLESYRNRDVTIKDVLRHVHRHDSFTVRLKAFILGHAA